MSALKALYERPYAVVFVAAVILSAHGLFLAATQLARINPWIAGLYILIVDVLAVSSYRTWTRGVPWAGGIALALALFTVALNVLGVFSEVAYSWVGQVVAGFPPVAALLAATLKIAEDRVVPTTSREEIPTEVTEVPTPPGDPHDLAAPSPAPEPFRVVTLDPEPPPSESPRPLSPAHQGYSEELKRDAAQQLWRGRSRSEVAAWVATQTDGRRPTPKTLTEWRKAYPSPLEAVR
jgi:hypothetical protein